MRLEKCWFCSSTVYPGHGMQFVRNDAKVELLLPLLCFAIIFRRSMPLLYVDMQHCTCSLFGCAILYLLFIGAFIIGIAKMYLTIILLQIFRFCRSKCHKNFKMKRNPRKVKWTKAYRRLHGKDMTQDSTFEFERKRNRPERYDRNLAENTLKAIKKIDKVRVDREAKHHALRMKGKKAKVQREATKELEQSIHMVKAPAALQQEPSLALPKIKVKVSHQQAEEKRQMEE
ncbi:hypothetical protein HHK36_019288 [Tetracentron sinense]|uniref:Large ribosomal subunit protein eL24-related N-terminal domain-containing protein n=1 Tax=Tetracentron sinense TaxID=13715 RepID=A0A835DC35_TETSI|nr:hypothetical protein HHK36_019288 [Tetracentron sinense]